METRKPYVNEESKLLMLDEDHFNDIKSSRIEPSSAQKHFVAFANSDGGELYIGIEDKKATGERIIGYDKQENANNVIQLLLGGTEPSVEGVEVEFIDFSTKGYVLHFTIPKSPRVHYTSKGECYLRINASTNKISGDKIAHLGYSKGYYSYEKIPVEHIGIDEIISSEFINDYMKRIDTSLEPFIFLKKQKLITKKDTIYFPNAGCILLFDEEPQASLDTKCAIKVYRLRTTEAEYKREYLEGHPITINGPIEIQILEVIVCLDRMLEDATYQVGDKLVKLKYPSEALKELLVNAVIHRDYSLNDDIHVRVYDNRIEILSPGQLPGYITLENILDERFARNPNIVRMLHNLPEPLNYDIGEGLNTAFNELRKAGLVDPEIIELDNAVLVIVKHELLASLEDLILDYLNAHEYITNKVVRELSGVDSENKIKHAFQKLRAKGLIEPEDPNARAFDFRYRKCNN